MPARLSIHHSVARWTMACALGLATFGCSGSDTHSNDEDSTQENSPTMSDDPIQAMRDFIASNKLDLEAGTSRTTLPKPPKANFPEGKTYYWDLKTNKGDIRVKLLPEVAPMHVSSTIYLTELGYYDMLRFHRVISRFMAQGGCPLGTGTGSPGYTYDGEFDKGVKHDRPGLLSMANAGPGTDGSQFFLTFVPTPHLDGKHTIFGQVEGDEGMETLKKLEKAGSQTGKPSETLKLEKATITVE